MPHLREVLVSRLPAPIIRFFAFALVMLLATPSFAARAIILVRHAEKAVDGTDDPPLSISGEDRALALTRLMRHNKVDAIFVTELKRTQQTAAVLAGQRGVKPTVVKAGDSAALLAAIAKLPADAVVVVVGHSNTLPDIIQALGVKEPVKIRDDEYGRVFVVTPTADPAAKGLLEFNY